MDFEKMHPQPIPCSAAVEALLAGAQLPVADVSQAAETGVLYLFGIAGGQELIAVGGIEPYGPVGLLRSLAVEKSHRKRGYGQVLVAHVEQWALQNGISTLFLLTVSAADFFRRLGYSALPRTEAPPAIRRTSQFMGLCPASSDFMRKMLR